MVPEGFQMQNMTELFCNAEVEHDANSFLHWLYHTSSIDFVSLTFSLEGVITTFSEQWMVYK